MAVVRTLSNHYKYKVMKGEIDFNADEFKVILMKDTFTFDKDTHATYLNVSGEEVGTGNGYTAKGFTLLSGELTENDSTDKGVMTWTDLATWVASGGSIGPAGAAIVFDETSDDDTIIGCIDFGEDLTATDGTSIQVNTIVTDLS